MEHPLVATEIQDTVSEYGENVVKTVTLMEMSIVALSIEGLDRLCLAQISNTLLKQFSYNEIHNRRVALGIRCIQCTPVQLEVLRRVGAMPVSSRRCGMITYREAHRLCNSFLTTNTPCKLPEDYTFQVKHECAWGSEGTFFPNKYISSRAKCVECSTCGAFFSPNKFIFHSHPKPETSKYVQTDAANFNAWRRHLNLRMKNPREDVVHAWEDVKCMFNGGSRKRITQSGQHRDKAATTHVNDNTIREKTITSSATLAKYQHAGKIERAINHSTLSMPSPASSIVFPPPFAYTHPSGIQDTPFQGYN